MKLPVTYFFIGLWKHTCCCFKGRGIVWAIHLHVVPLANETIRSGSFAVLRIGTQRFHKTEWLILLELFHIKWLMVV